MHLTAEEFNEFRIEALELIDEAERQLLSLDSGGDFKTAYDSIFRAFHNLKGSAGMLELIAVQTVMHDLETKLTAHKEDTQLDQAIIDYLLKGCDRVRHLFNDGASASASEPTSPAPVVPIAPTAAPTPTVTVHAVPRSNDHTNALELLLLYYPDLDTFLEMRGEESERHSLRLSITNLLLEQQKAGT